MLLVASPSICGSYVDLATALVPPPALVAACMQEVFTLSMRCIVAGEC